MYIWCVYIYTIYIYIHHIHIYIYIHIWCIYHMCIPFHHYRPMSLGGFQPCMTWCSFSCVSNHGTRARSGQQIGGPGSRWAQPPFTTTPQIDTSERSAHWQRKSCPRKWCSRGQTEPEIWWNLPWQPSVKAPSWWSCISKRLPKDGQYNLPSTRAKEKAIDTSELHLGRVGDMVKFGSATLHPKAVVLLPCPPSTKKYL